MADRRRPFGVLVTALALLLLASTAPSSAQLLDDGDDGDDGGSTTSTSEPDDGGDDDQTDLLDGSTTTTTSSTSTTTSSTTSTTAPPEEPGEPDDGGGSGDPQQEPTPAPEGAGDGEAADGVPEDDATPRTIPPEAQAVIDGVARTGSNSSRDLHEAVQELVELGLSPEEAVRVGFGRFPVAGVATYSHDWLYPRWGPGFRFHLGTDVFAPYGTPLRSPVDGTVTSGHGTLGGLYVKVFTADGTYFYLAHLSGLPDGFEDGMEVRTGDIVGYIGTSGNAKGTPPHVHLGLYPQGGDPVDPKPVLDRMLADAMEALPAVIERVRANRPDVEASAPRAPRVPRSLVATSMLRPLLDARAAGGLSTTVLFEAVGNPTSGGLAIAETEAGALAAAIDWEARAADERTGHQLRARTEELFRATLGPFAGLSRGDDQGSAAG